MPRKGENIYKRSDGRWEGRYEVGRNPETDSIQYGYIYARSYNECRKLKALAEQEHKKPMDKIITVATCLDLWLEQRSVGAQLRIGTLQLYARQIEDHIKPNLGGYRLSKLTSEALERFRIHQLRNGRLDRSGGLSQSVVNTQMVIVKSMLAYAVRKGYLNKAPEFDKQKSGQSKEREIHVLDHAEQERLESAVFRGLQERGNENAGLYMGVFFALYTGLRIGELGGLQWKNINFSTRVVTVKQTLQRIKSQEDDGQKTKVVLGPAKTDKSIRTNPMGLALTTMLEKYYKKLPLTARRPDSFVFTHHGKPIEPRLFQLFFKRILKEASITDANFHALRHTFATRCLEGGVDLQSLCEIMGHSNATITAKRYAHSLMQHKTACINKLNFLSNEWRQLA